MNIEQLAREAGFTPQRDERLFTDMLTRFAALVRAQALEDAARECEVLAQVTYGMVNSLHEYGECAAAIRALA